MRFTFVLGEVVFASITQEDTNTWRLTALASPQLHWMPNKYQSLPEAADAAKMLVPEPCREHVKTLTNSTL